MAVFETTRPVAHTSFSGNVARLVAFVTKWNDARTTRKALSQLSDRELNDIGLCRGDIEAIAARD
ncbi:DUF1127 domain-containing protein [Ostreiculturibacter nitratireducens]|uniref:DUF1127 domain-containing protein n=1 Tax=Ostreiculturibacter nitratireducens TaxID=3075226 RepID=UPI0031B571BD